MRSFAPRGAASKLALAALALAVIPAEAATPCRERAPTTWDLAIATPSERGDRLVLSGRVVDRSSGRGIGGVTMYAYHADASGRYNQFDNEGLEARLCGVLRTDSQGRFRIRTVMPGGAGGDPHLHAEFWGPNVHRVMRTIELGPASARPSNENAVEMRVPVRRDKSGVFHATWRVAVDQVDSKRLPVLPTPKGR